VLELLQLSNKSDWESVNSYLVNRGWEYYNSIEGDNESYNIVGWSFEKSNYNDKAQAWFHLYTYIGYPNKVCYQFHNKLTYNTIKSTLASNGFKYIDSEIKDDEVISKYANPFFIIQLSYIKSEQEDYSETSHTTYLVTVIKKTGVYDVDNGLKKSYDASGNLESEYTLKDSKVNGTAKSYYSNGKLKIVSNFVSGIKQGISKEYNEDGKLTGEYTYVNGEASGSYKIYEDGKLKLIGTLRDGKRNRQFKVYDEDGNLDREYVMKDDELNGNYIEYYYKDNKLILKNSGQYFANLKSGLWKIVKIKEKETDLLSFYNYLNGEYEGAFKEVNNDSIIFGSYQNGILNGKYKIYKSLWSYLSGELTGDTSGAILVTSGNYLNGQKSGSWKYYSLTKVLIKEGSYADDEKTGEWKYYFDKILKNEKSDEYETYSKQLYLVENYEKGKLNGKTIQTSTFETVQILCDTSIYKSKSPIDTCYSYIYEKFNQVAYYINGKLNGPFEYKDSIGVLRYKGTFINGLKEGLWIESYKNNNSDGEHFYIYDRGNYSTGKKNGIWDEYIKEDFIITKYNYSNGKLNGRTIEYNLLHKPKEEKYFEDGKLKTLITYDSLGTSLHRKYEIISETNNDLKCRRTDFNESGKVSQIYWMKKQNEELNHNFFELFFLINTGSKFSDGSKAYADGEFKVYSYDDKVLVEGSYLKKDKIGKWKFYYYDVNVYIEQDYINDVGGVARYFVLNSGQQFSGKFIQKFDNGKLKYEFKISSGLRDGKSKYFDESGEEVKIEKYEKGVIKN
jgi:antitoxin component YwqK of YwqJK toxin-antitoxin module